MSTFRNIVRRILGRPPPNQALPFDFARNRFRAKKKWPPNLHELTERQQFRIERKFKRRSLLKSQRPVWNKWVKIVQWNLIGGITVWTLFFADFRKDKMNPRPGEQPFEGLRNWVKDKFDGLWTHTASTQEKRSLPDER
ncbi:hypothetical protein BDV96DRAFT_509506 [Lophiotrema nucula]|uniref:Uncharacterized protein n=1 Tax=Lophiotrema nucula TaxID=690887 RepID=A0A6A5YGS3_9PLEO|nr:hypothetical protein BDV96DRAFT_509506 [Lophiotrema nucula]